MNSSYGLSAALSCLLAATLLQSPAPAVAQTFADVPTDYWAYDFVETLAASGVTGGCGGGNYCPESSVTRAQMAVFLERGINGSEFVPAAATGTVFDDVAMSDFAANFIERLYADGITGGCGGSNYCPNASVTRAQMAVFLLRAEHGSAYEPPAATGQFGDVPMGYWAAPWIEQLAVEKITGGCGSGNYCPESSVTRAQMAVFLVRTFGLEPPAEPVPLYLLGDSLSDTGNAAGFADYIGGLTIYPPTIGLCNPYDVLVLAQGCSDLYYEHRRVTDGLVAFEYVSAELGNAELLPSLHPVPSRPVMGTNYAVASGKAVGAGPEDLDAQVDALLLDVGPSLPPDAVYAIAIGGNDEIDALQVLAAGGPNAEEDSALIVASAVLNISGNVARLANAGARRVMVVNVPNLAQLPSVRAAAAASGDEAAFLAIASGVTESFNTELDGLLTALETGGLWVSPVPISRFDLESVLLEIGMAAENAGSNVVDACFDSEAYRDSVIAERTFHPECEPAGPGMPPGFDNFLFWDIIHPTGVTHAAIGAALIEAIPAPLP